MVYAHRQTYACLHHPDAPINVEIIHVDDDATRFNVSVKVLIAYQEPGLDLEYDDALIDSDSGKIERGLYEVFQLELLQDADGVEFYHGITNGSVGIEFGPDGPYEAPAPHVSQMGGGRRRRRSIRYKRGGRRQRATRQRRRKN
jgi:hypothetical protein